MSLIADNLICIDCDGYLDYAARLLPLQACTCPQPEPEYELTNIGPLAKPRWSNPTLLTDEFARFERERKRA